MTVIESSVTGSITIGGVIGRTSSTGTHSYLAYSGTVSSLMNPSNQNTTDGNNAGGLIGKMQKNTVLRKSFFNGHISGGTLVGGLVGRSSVLSMLLMTSYQKFTIHTA